MMQAGCCCGCSCPSGTPNPSSVTATITIVDCCGTSHTVVKILSNTVTLNCPACITCPKYQWNPSLSPGGCTGFLCETLGGWKCSNDCSADALAMIDSIGLGTDGSFFIDPENPEVGYCQNWAISLRVTAAIQGEYITPSAIYYDPETYCLICRWGYACSFFVDCDRSEAILCKQASATPLGTYTNCSGQPLDSCTWNDGCMSITSVVIS